MSKRKTTRHRSTLSSQACLGRTDNNQSQKRPCIRNPPIFWGNPNDFIAESTRMLRNRNVYYSSTTNKKTRPFVVQVRHYMVNTSTYVAITIRSSNLSTFSEQTPLITTNRWGTIGRHCLRHPVADTRIAVQHGRVHTPSGRFPTLIFSPARQARKVKRRSMRLSMENISSSRSFLINHFHYAYKFLVFLGKKKKRLGTSSKGVSAIRR